MCFRQNDKCNLVAKQNEDQDEEKESQVNRNQSGTGTRRSPRKQLHSLADGQVPMDANLQLSKLKIPDINNANQQNGKHKSKHHRSKAKHHKDKRKKKKHAKNDEVDEVIVNTDDNTTIGMGSENITEQMTTSLNKTFDDDNNIVESLKLDVELTNIRGSRDESVIQKTEKIDNIVLVSNLDSGSIDDNFHNNNKELINGENSLTMEINSELTKNLSSQCSVVKHTVNSTVLEINNKDVYENSQGTNDPELYRDQQQQINNNSSHDDTATTEKHKLFCDPKLIDDLDEKKIKKKRKHLKHDTENSDKNETASVTIVSEPITKQRKKKHKHLSEHKNKKNHDGRKAPQDGVISAEKHDSQSEKSEIITSTPSNPSQVESENDENILEPQRLAIKIKLCQDCNNRHIQGACPLMSAVYTISDLLTYEEWLDEHKQNEEVIRAIAIQDPMSDGYGKMLEDGFESDDDSTSDQYKSKLKAQSEEKCLQVDNERPLYARASLPNCLQLKMTNTEHGLGIYAKDVVPIYSKLGPLIGTPVKEMDIPDDFSMRHIWEIESESKTYISTTNPLKSNWVRYMRPAETKDERSVAVIIENGKLYFVTTRNITSGDELTYWADSSSFTWTRKNKTDKTNCGGCNLTFIHTIYYRLHCCIFHDTNYSLTIRKYHCKVCGAAVLGKDNIMKHAAELHAGRGAYQCQYCRKFFLRLNYLEMHRTYGCAQNPQRSRPLCDFCGRKFCQPQKLKVHIKRMHSGEHLNNFFILIIL